MGAGQGTECQHAEMRDCASAHTDRADRDHCSIVAWLLFVVLRRMGPS